MGACGRGGQVIGRFWLGRGSKSIFKAARWTYGRLVGGRLDGADKSALRIYRKWVRKIFG